MYEREQQGKDGLAQDHRLLHETHKKDITDSFVSWNVGAKTVSFLRLVEDEELCDNGRTLKTHRGQISKGLSYNKGGVSKNFHPSSVTSVKDIPLWKADGNFPCHEIGLRKRHSCVVSKQWRCVA